jgi:hypothetical protein
MHTINLSKIYIYDSLATSSNISISLRPKTGGAQ